MVGGARASFWGLLHAVEKFGSVQDISATILIILLSLNLGLKQSFPEKVMNLMLSKFAIKLMLSE